MEYIHRMWGRCIGLVFFIPACVFYYKNRIPKSQNSKIKALAVIILLQVIYLFLQDYLLFSN